MSSLITSQDIENECAIAGVLQQKWGCMIHSLGRYSPIDFYAERGGKPHAFIELKCRNKNSFDHKTVMLSLRKFLDLRRAAEAMGCESIFVVSFNDGLFYAKITDDMTGMMCSIGGRSDRPGLKNDTEPVFRFPISRMKKVAERGEYETGRSENHS